MQNLVPFIAVVLPMLLAIAGIFAAMAIKNKVEWYRLMVVERALIIEENHKLKVTEAELQAAIERSEAVVAAYEREVVAANDAIASTDKLSTLRADEIRNLQAEVGRLQGELAAVVKQRNEDRTFHQMDVDKWQDERRKLNGHATSAQDELKRVADSANVLDRDLKLCQKHLRECRKYTDEQKAYHEKHVGIAEVDRLNAAAEANQLRGVVTRLHAGLVEGAAITKSLAGGWDALIRLANPSVPEPPTDLGVHGDESLLGSLERAQDD